LDHEAYDATRALCEGMKYINSMRLA
jgi:hypothetical protein